MTNADKFKNLFGIYATELWSMPEKDFLKWLNSEAVNSSEIPNKSDMISRQAAIDSIRYAGKIGKLTCIDILEQLPSVRSEERTGTHSCDCISRQAAILIASGYCHPANIAAELSKLPPVQPERKTGHWITKPHIYGVSFCSECDFELRIDDTKYCPNCSARMIEPHESEE